MAESRSQFICNFQVVIQFFSRIVRSTRATRRSSNVSTIVQKTTPRLAFLIFCNSSGVVVLKRAQESTTEVCEQSSRVSSVDGAFEDDFPAGGEFLEPILPISPVTPAI